MARLLVLNGPPGIGKSTLARRYVDEHPFSLCLDLDQVRGQVGGWRTDESRSGELARDLSVAMVRTHLENGYDVVVPQFVARPAYLDRLTALGSVEVLLTAPLEEAQRRFDTRDTEHGRVAREMVEAAGGYPRQYDALMAMYEDRPVVRIASTDPDGTYTALLAALPP